MCCSRKRKDQTTKVKSNDASLPGINRTVANANVGPKSNINASITSNANVETTVSTNIETDPSIDSSKPVKLQTPATTSQQPAPPTAENICLFPEPLSPISTEPTTQTTPAIVLVPPPVKTPSQVNKSGQSRTKSMSVQTVKIFDLQSVTAERSAGKVPKDTSITKEPAKLAVIAPTKHVENAKPKIEPGSKKPVEKVYLQMESVQTTIVDKAKDEQIMDKAKPPVESPKLSAAEVPSQLNSIPVEMEKSESLSSTSSPKNKKEAKKPKSRKSKKKDVKDSKVKQRKRIAENRTEALTDKKEKKVKIKEKDAKKKKVDSKHKPKAKSGESSSPS